MTTPTTTPGPRYLDDRGWPLIDRLLVGLFTEHIVTPELAECGTVLHTGTYPAIKVVRLPGGGINADGYEDVSRIEITTYGRTRPESDTLTAQVRQLMADLSDDEYAGVGVDRIREETGPGRIPDPDEDINAVPTTWSVTARQQRLP